LNFEDEILLGGENVNPEKKEKKRVGLIKGNKIN
jgi:hypothetical protein